MKFYINKDAFNKEDFFIFLPKSKRMLSFKRDMNIELNDILCVDEQKKILYQNTKSFINNGGCNNILLWGARGMGKSTLVKCVIKAINNESKQKIKLIEFLNSSIDYLPDVIFDLSRLKKKFIVFIDDIAFNNNQDHFRLFKSLIEGSLLSNSGNIIYYVTSNLRHLSIKDNSKNEDDLSRKEILSNILALSDRFGCWVGFHENDKENYLKIINHYIKKYSKNHNHEIDKKALEWSLAKGNFSGRTAYQFIQNLKIKI